MLIDRIRTHNLRLLADHYGTIAALAAQIQKSHSQTSQWVHGSIDRPNNGRNISTKWARIVEERCGLPNGWLDLERESFNAGPTFVRRYPVVDWKRAKTWFENPDPDTSGYEKHPCPHDLSEHAFCLKMKDDAMTAPVGTYPTFPPGTVVFIAPPKAEIAENAIVLIGSKSNPEAILRRYTIIDGEPGLEALNPAWPTRYIKLTKEHAILGVAAFFGNSLPY